MKTPQASTNVSAASSFQRLAETARQPIYDTLQPAFQSMLDQLPAYLVECASRLTTQQQQLMLDVIVRLRHQSTPLETRILPALDQRLIEFIALTENQMSDEQDASSLLANSISLMAADAIEIDVAINTIAQSLSQHLEPMLGDAFSRLQVLCPKVVQSDRLPFHPASLLHITLDAIAPLELQGEQKIRVLELIAPLFDWTALAEWLQIALDEAEIPELDRAVRQSDSSAPAPRQKPEDLQDVLRDIRNMGQIAGGRGGVGSPTTTPITAPDSPAVAAGQILAPGQHAPAMPDPQGLPILHLAAGGGLVIDPGILTQQAAHFPQVSPSVAQVPLIPANIFPLAQEQLVQTQELIQLLTRLQDILPKTLTDNGVIAATGVREQIREQLHNTEEKVEVIAKQETDVIDLMSMMFDFILDDEQLPTRMKALLARLQIPMLKIALLDRTFFTGETHPARRLLNLLAKAGIGWDEKARSSEQLFQRIEKIVFRILEEFDSEIGLFDTLLAEFEPFYELHMQRVAQVDARTREAEENRAKADQARLQVQQALNERLTGRHLPLAVIRLLEEGWRHVLYLAAVKEGTEAESWRQALKVVDALIWSVLPPVGDQAWLERLRQVSPKLLHSLRKGLSSVNFDSWQTEQLLGEIQKVHQDTLNGTQVSRVEIIEANDENQAADQDSLTVDEAVKAGKPGGKALDQVARVILPTTRTPVDQFEGLSSTDRYVAEVNQLPIGSWIEFMFSDHTERHKLVARIKSTGKLIFANHRGVKVAETTIAQLALSLHHGSARLLDSKGEIIDRTLQHMVEKIREVAV